MVGGIAVGVLGRDDPTTVVMKAAAGERGAPGHGIVFYSGRNEAGVAEADQFSDWEYVEHNQPLGITYSDWAEGGCSPDAAATHPSDRNLHVLVGYSIGRLGPLYFLRHESRWNEVDTIWLLDPGAKGDIESSCDGELAKTRRPGQDLAKWLAGGTNRRLVVVSARATNSDDRAGLQQYYLNDIAQMTPDVANRALLCIDTSTGHRDVPGVYMPLIHGAISCPARANGVGSGPLAGTATLSPLPPAESPSNPPPPAVPDAPVEAPPAAPSPDPPPAPTPVPAPVPSAPTPPVPAPSTPPVVAAPSPQPPPAPAPAPRIIETTGGETHTWTNYRNAGGQPGPVFPAHTDVEIGCKLRGFAVANGNTWWYRIGSGPFYASADAFYNNGARSGPLKGTPYVDPAVPDC